MFGGGRGSPAGFQRWLAPSATYRPPNLIRFLGFDTEPLQQVSLLLRGRPGRGAAQRPDPPAQNRRAGYQVENSVCFSNCIGIPLEFAEYGYQLWDPAPSRRAPRLQAQWCRLPDARQANRACPHPAERGGRPRPPPSLAGLASWKQAHRLGLRSESAPA